MIRHLTRLGMIAALLSTTGSCADGVKTTKIALPDPVCLADTDCNGADRCITGYCVVQNEPQRTLELTFIPSASSGHLAQRLGAIALDPDEQQEFVLEPSLLVSGRVSFTSSVREVVGTLLFQPEGLSERIFTRQTQLDERGRFEVVVPPGRYTITFVPNNTGQDAPLTPGRVWRAQQVEANTELLLRMPNPDQIEQITNYVVTGGGLDDVRGIPDVRAVAIASETGDTSTTAVTDTEGQFTLYLWRDSATYDLYLSPSHLAAAPAPLATLTGWWTSSTPVSNQNIEFPGYTPPTRQVVARLSNRALRDDVVALSAMQVIVRAQTEDGTLTMIRSLDASGAVQLNLAERVYSIELVTPLESRYGGVTQTFDATDLLASSIVLDPPAKAAVSLQVRAPEGAPVSGARVELTAKSGDGTTNAAAQIPLKTTTDEQGIAQLWLSPQEYTVHVIPDATTGMARAIRTITRAELEGSPETLEVTLPRASLLRGTVWSETTGDFRGQERVLVQVHERREGARALIGEGETDARGDFQIIIPSQLP